MKIIKARGLEPTLAEDVFVADGAKIIGDVHIGKKSSVWFNTIKVQINEIIEERNKKLE